MNATIGVLCALLSSATPEEAAAPTLSDLTGAWSGTLSHGDETTVFALEVEPDDNGQALVKMSIPGIHVAHNAIGRVPVAVKPTEVKIGPFTFTYDAKAKTLRGTMPKALVPVYDVPVVLARVATLELPARAALDAPAAQPLWTFDGGAPLWAGATFVDGVVYAGGEDGRLHALDARTGKERWSFKAAGAIRTRASVSGGNVFFQADDGVLYALLAASGRERWHLKLVEKPIERLPFDNPKSRYDRFGSDVTVSGGRLYVGTHDGRIVALDPARGARLWEFAAGDSVLAAPAVASGRVYFGSYDGSVYALDAASGQLAWKHDTKAPVVSTPALAGGKVLVGSRSYDFVALDEKTGTTAWQRYMWFSWVESSASIGDGVAYVGSSDAAAVFAYDVGSGRSVWTADVYGWAWGQPALSDTRVYIGTASTKGYLAGHRGGVLALDRKTGRAAWQFGVPAPETGSYGFPGSPALGAGLLFVAGLDGRVYAFKQ
jgi:outer membrane protein assembly factor BamB